MFSTKSLAVFLVAFCAATVASAQQCGYPGAIVQHDGSCACPPGFYGNGHQCYDANECAPSGGTATGGGYCQHPMECINTPGSYQCNTCLPGYTLQNGQCVDVNECLTTCNGANQVCHNYPGGHLCRCAAGYEGASCTAITGPVSCTQDSDCISGQMCNRNSCGDSTGICTVPDLTCNNDSPPVKGCNGNTYTTPCLAQAAQTAINGTLRGCKDQSDCDWSEYCNQPTCSSAGICEKKPHNGNSQLCPAGGPKVWGCPMVEQGKEFPPAVHNSACHSKAQGLAPDLSLAVTNCTNNNDCGSTQYCYFSYGCGNQANTVGYCRPKPDQATCTKFSPVLGCDNIQYTSRCVAESVGINTDREIYDICPALSQPFTGPAPYTACTGGSICKSDYQAPGGYRCDCQPGHQWVDSDVKMCIDVDECASPNLNNCHAEATCTNTVGGYTCACKSGFSGNGTSCVGLDDECGLGTHNCGAHAVCTNTDASFTCSCPSGFTGNGTASDCIDIDECPNVECPANSVCVNTPGSAACGCRNGFKQVGTATKTFQTDIVCEDINECAADTNPCKGGKVCSNTVGGFTCACATGFEENPNGQCVDINECLTNPCGANSECHNQPGGYTCGCSAPYKIVGGKCICPAGYSIVNGQCVDVDECSAGTHSCPDVSTCNNTPGGYTCKCDTGYSTRLDRALGIYKCVDINECRSGTHNCDSLETCYNTVGSYQCYCRNGIGEASALGMASGDIKASQLSASTTAAGSEDKEGWRLGALPDPTVAGTTSSVTTTGWCPKENKVGEYVEAVFEKAVSFSGLATQGLGGAAANNFIRTYTLQFLNPETNKWYDYSEWGRIRTFYGNWNNIQVSRQGLRGPETVKGVRILPQTWIGNACIRFEFYSAYCKAICGNGILERGEDCDDGNADSCDGCTAECEVEAGWTCAGDHGEKSECRRRGDNSPSFDIPPTPERRYTREGYNLGFYVQATSPIKSRVVKIEIARVVDLDPPPAPSPSPISLPQSPVPSPFLPPTTTQQPGTTNPTATANPTAAATATAAPDTTTATATADPATGTIATQPATDKTKCPPRLPPKTKITCKPGEICLPNPTPSGMSIRLHTQNGATSKYYFRWSTKIGDAGKWKICFRAYDAKGESNYHCVYTKVYEACPNSCSGNGKCSLNRCICDKEWEGRDCSRKRIGRCYSYGDPRFRTFDGLYRTFNGIGVYNLHGSGGLSVKTRQEKAGTGSLNTGVFVRYATSGNKAFTFQIQNKEGTEDVWANGEKITPPTSNKWLNYDGDVKVWVYHGRWPTKSTTYIMNFPDGRTVRAYLFGTKWMNVMVYLKTEWLDKRMSGLCGTFNANPADDWRPPAGRRLLSTTPADHQAGQANNACGEDTGMQFPAGETCESVSEPDFVPNYDATFATPEAAEAAAKACASVKSDDRLYQECLSDVATTGTVEVASGVVANAAETEADSSADSICGDQPRITLDKVVNDPEIQGTYALHDNSDPHATPLAVTDDCAGSVSHIPNGWEVAPVNEETKKVLKKYPLGSECIVLADGNGYDADGIACASQVLVKPETGKCRGTTQCDFKALLVKQSTLAAAASADGASGTDGTSTFGGDANSISDNEQGGDMFGTEEAADAPLGTASEKKGLGLLPELWQEIALIAGVVCVAGVIIAAAIIVRRRRQAAAAGPVKPVNYLATSTSSTTSLSQVDLVSKGSTTSLEVAALTPTATASPAAVLEVVDVSEDEELDIIRKAVSAN